MAVEGLTITAVEPHGDAHEAVTASAAYAVDPTLPANQGIVDLDRVATGPDGLVRFDGDVRILRPRDGIGNGRLVLVAANRGRALGAPSGEARLLAAGWTVAWCGWQWDVQPAPGMVALAAPAATDNGVPVGAPVRIEVLTDAPIADHALADRTGAFRRYPAVAVDDADATLTERDWWDGPRRAVPRDRWRFARVVDGQVVPDDEHVWLDGGFRPGVYYELTYTSRISPVAGAGLLAFRDLGSFLRHGGAGGEPHTHAIASGGSQSGRFLRQWLSEGLNLDEAGRQVFDGALVEVAGGRRGEVNHRGAQPALMYPVGFSTLPPFAHADLLARQRAAGGVPRVVFTNSAWEYWLGDAALTHVDLGGADLAEVAEVRSYFFAGVDHYGGLMSYKTGLPIANPPNPLDAGLLARAAFENLVAWACDGREPPPSRLPRAADATAATRADVLAAMPAIPGGTPADPGALPWLRAIDLGPDADKGVGRWPAVETDARPDLVSAVDADGNEVAGVQLPQVVVPVGTFTGWNPRRPESGLPATLYARCGSFWPFARTEAERRASGDPRPSIAERYRDRDDYADRVGDAVDALVGDGLLVADDAPAAIEAALRLYDEVTAGP